MYNAKIINNYHVGYVMIFIFIVISFLIARHMYVYVSNSFSSVTRSYLNQTLMDGVALRHNTGHLRTINYNVWLLGT